MSSVIRTRDDWTPWYERTKAELTRLAGAEIHVGILGSADSELLRIAAVQSSAQRFTRGTPPLPWQS